jgi:hypothetical protein
MLKKSSFNPNADVSEDNMAENLDQKGSDGLNCVNSKFLHMYNQQGNYAVEQSICNMLGIQLLCGKLHTDDTSCRLRDIRFILKAIASILLVALIVMAIVVILWTRVPGANE